MSAPNGLMSASIVVSGKSISVPELDELFGVVSTSTWKAKPEVVAQVSELQKEEWRLEQVAQTYFSFSDALDPLIDQFRARIDQIATYCKQRGLTISAHIELNGMDRSFILGFDRPLTLINLAGLGSEFYVHTEKLKCLQSYE